MFEKIISFFKGLRKDENKKNTGKSKDTAKERLHLVLMQDRANVSVDFLELMKQEIIDVIKKYIEVDEGAIDVRLTNKTNDDGTNGAPALYANIPITSIKYAAKDTENVKYVENVKNQTVKKEENKEEQDVKNEETEEKKEEDKIEENKEVQEEKEEEPTQEINGKELDELEDIVDEAIEKKAEIKKEEDSKGN